MTGLLSKCLGLCYLARNNSSLMCRLITCSIIKQEIVLQMKRAKPLLPAIGIFCLALLVRVIYNNTVAHNYFPLHDSLFYQTIGLNIVKEHCFCLHPYISTVYRPPLWPFIIRAISLVFLPGAYYAPLFFSLPASGTCPSLFPFPTDLS